jgi:acyl carrier protein|tara:strand:- start:235 stop:465 length:231 start_codon:yes stop_codon:yes gene_type:complete
MIKEKIKLIMAEVFEMNQDLINDNITQKDTAEWDSLSHLNLIVEIEEEFSVSFTPEKIGSMISMELIIHELKKSKL